MAGINRYSGRARLNRKKIGVQVLEQQKGLSSAQVLVVLQLHPLWLVVALPVVGVAINPAFEVLADHALRVR